MAKRRPRSPGYTFDRDRDGDRNLDRDYTNEYDVTEPAAKPQKSAKGVSFTATTMAILSGIFILGIGIGIALTSVTSSSAASSGTKINNLIDLDSKAPNADVCVQFGASAIVTDMRVFVTLNPLNFYVSQPTSRPGCVMRNNNWSVLEQRGLLKSEKVRECKQRMNTFGYTGKLEENPDIQCVYQNDVAGNLFISPDANGQRTGEADNQRF
jgi:Protein of unknown function (DUF3172)